MVESGNLEIDNQIMYRISELKLPSVNYTSDDAELDKNNILLLEVGRTIFVKMRLCNVAKLCVIREVATVVIINSLTETATSENGTRVNITVSLPDGEDGTKNNLNMETPEGEL